MAEKKLTEVEVKLRSAKLKLAEAKSLNLAQADEIADLKMTLVACGAHCPSSPTSWVQRGVVGSLASNGSSRRFPTEEPRADSILGSSPLVQSQAVAANEEDTPSMRELMHAINTHVEMVDLEVTSNLNVAENAQVQNFPTNPLTEDAPDRPADDAVQFSPADV